MDVPTFEALFSQIKINMWAFGMSFHDYNVVFRFHCFVVSMGFMLVEETSFFISRYAPENFLELTQLAPCLGIALLSVLKILPIAAKKQKISDLTKSLNGLYNTILADPKKRAVVRNEILLVKTIIKYFFILNAILITVYNFAPLAFMLYAYLKHNRIEFKVPYAVSVPFALDTYPKWFVVYFHSIISGFVCILFVTTVDALYCMLTSQICSNLIVISNEILHLNESNVHRLKEIIMSHQYVLKLSEDLEEIFKLVNLFNVLVGSTEICALGFNITIGDLGHLPGYVLFLASVLLQILLMSVFGEKLICESRKVGDAAFNCKWYDMELKYKKMIVFIIARSQKQQQLTAYKFSVICHRSFTKIISTSWSYFTILRTVYTAPSESGHLE